jgi:tetratricopeptide (TPR) repeat protein
MTEPAVDQHDPATRIMLGLRVAQQFLSTPDEDPDRLALLASALDLLSEAEHTVAPDDPDGPEAITTLGRLYVLRHMLTGSNDLDHGIDLLRRVAGQVAEAADLLATALDVRYHARNDPADRDEEIALLEELSAEFLGYLDTRTVELGSLYLGKLEEDPTQENFERAVEHLEHALRQGVPDTEHVPMLLAEAYLRRWGRVPPEPLMRLRAMCAEMADAEPFCAFLLLLIDAENAVSPDEIRGCVTRLADELFGPYREDKDPHILAGVLAALLAALHGVTRPGWSPFGMGASGAFEEAAELRDWLRDNQVPDDSPDRPLFVASTALLVAHLPVPPQEAVAELAAALDVLPAGHPAIAQIEYELGRRDVLDLDRRLALLSSAATRFAPDDPARARCLAALGMTLFSGYTQGLVHQNELARADELISNALAATELDAEDQAMLLTALGTVRGMWWLVDPARGDVRDGLAHFEQALDILPSDHPFRLDIRYSVSNLLIARSTLTRNIDDAMIAETHLRAIQPLVAEREGEFANPEQVALLLCAARLARITYGDTVSDGDAEELDEIISELRTLPDGGGPLAWAQTIRAQRRGEHRAVIQLAESYRTTAAALPRDMPFKRTVDSLATLMRAGEAVLNDDDQGLADQIAELTASAYAPDTSTEERARLLHMLGGTWIAAYTRSREPHMLDKAIAALEESRAQMATTEPFGLFADEQLSTLYWQRGDTEQALASGFAALHGHARQVLLHEEVAHGASKASTMADNAHALALRCVAAGQPERAVAAIEGGRGLAMHAATSDVGAVLRELGHEDMALEWEHNERPEIPTDLRYRVLELLAGTGEERRLLSTPSAGDIGGALREIGADALVYVVPGAGGLPGCAIYVRPDGRVGLVPLPLLGTDEVDRYLTAYRDATKTGDEHAIDRWRAELGELVRWAWPAVVGPVLAELTGHLVLVPCGSLGVVPWHAALDDTGRYAVAHATFSYIASGRQLCDVAGRPRREAGEDPVVVADPTSDLASSPKEALYLRRHHYPDGEYYGVLPRGVPQDGPGSPEDVLDLLPSASLLHLSCHARTGPTPAESYVELTERLTVTQVLRHTKGRPKSGGLVVLAACASDLADREHDEALTLATAFLAAGAGSVVGTRWEVNDKRAAVLMCLFHHYLAELGKPAEALRAAQLWALDPARVLPAAIAEVVDAVDIPLTAWAAFSHQGR